MNRFSFSETPFQQVVYQGQDITVKRDDLIALEGVENQHLKRAFSGNKARKLYAILNSDQPNIKRLVGYGSAQSNMLHSLAVLASIKGWGFDYYVDHVADYLRANPMGNYAVALKLGARIREGKLPELEQHAKDDEVLFIPEGGRTGQAEPGIKILANEISTWIDKNHLVNPKIMLPSGTGTTALYLQKHLFCEVMTCACVGDSDYLHKQFLALETDIRQHPKMLLPPNEGRALTGKYHFGKLYPEFYEVWQSLRVETGIQFELLYDPLGWLCMLNYLESTKDLDQQSVDMIYIHQGGLLGNETMEPRYQRLLRE